MTPQNSTMTASNDLIIRRARHADVSALIELLRDDELGTGREIPAGESLPKPYEEAFDEISASPTSELYAAEENGRVIGSFQLDFLRRLARRGARIAEIESVHVHSTRRGHGLGTKMMLFAISRARERGCVRLQLTTQKVRVDAHRFYTRLGFVASHEGMKLAL